jgi:hypothetical protein
MVNRILQCTVMVWLDSRPCEGNHSGLVGSADLVGGIRIFIFGCRKSECLFLGVPQIRIFIFGCRKSGYSFWGAATQNIHFCGVGNQNIHVQGGGNQNINFRVKTLWCLGL